MHSAVPTTDDLLPSDDPAQAAELTAKASKCRRLARSITDPRAAEALTSLADEYDIQARSLQPAG